ncbi:FAD-dependent oxidoreductase [Candidatus Woesearchaeota archaeon]|nr:FAD-dependent oxidoreductase [Candidatus Woesearchaeota archaeon]
MRVGILGGGLTALTIANGLKAECEVLEKEPECGGLCRSTLEKGFTFDQGGHILYSKDTETLNWMLEQLGGNKAKKRRNNRVFVKGRKIKYPFENDLAHLPLMENWFCLYNYLFNPYKKKPKNFKEWIYHTFGRGIAEVYLVPYNEKIWNFPPEHMSLHWVDGRVPKPPKIDVIKSSIGIPTEGYKHQLYFFYPKHEGIQALIKALEEDVKFKCNFEVKSIEKLGSKWFVSDGKRKKGYDQLISTIPIQELLKALPKVPPKVKKAVNDLRFNSLITVMIGINRPKLNDMTALYIPTRDVAFHRVCFMNNFSEYAAPQGKFGIIAEITVNKGDGIFELSDEEVIEKVVDGLHKLKIIDKDDVVFSKAVRAEYAYVVYNLDYLENIKIVRGYIESLGIILCGRFAEFEYLNMDACVKRALELAKRLNNGEKSDSKKEKKVN